MNRRIFVKQFATGVLLYTIPTSLVASNLVARPKSQLANGQGPPDRVAALLRNGQLGTIQRLAITRAYSPALTSVTTLQAMATQDFALANQLVGTDLFLDARALFIDSPSAAFGSYSARFDSGNMTTVWQGLARIGHQKSSQTDTLTGTLRFFGSKGVLTLDTAGSSYQWMDLQGRIVEAKGPATYAVSKANGSNSFEAQG